MRQIFSLIAWMTLLAICLPASAATTPEINKILQESTHPGQPLTPPPATIPDIKSPEQVKPAMPAGAAEVRINVTHFAFKGNDSIDESTLRHAIAESENKSLNFGELMAVVEKVEALYKSRGYFLAQAYLPPQKIKDGTIEISVSEGKLG